MKEPTLNDAIYALGIDGGWKLREGKIVQWWAEKEQPSDESIQAKLKELGYDVGAVDGILGAKTRRSVQKVQKALNQPAAAWPTIELLETH